MQKITLQQKDSYFFGGRVEYDSITLYLHSKYMTQMETCLLMTFTNMQLTHLGSSKVGEQAVFQTG